jgi:hypothetical protein
VRGLKACTLVMSSLLGVNNRPPNLDSRVVCERFFVRITMVHLNLVLDFHFV